MLPYLLSIVLLGFLSLAFPSEARASSFLAEEDSDEDSDGEVDEDIIIRDEEGLDEDEDTEGSEG